MSALTDCEKVLSVQTSFCRFGSLGMHPRLWRLALHLGGSACIAVAVVSPVKWQENEARGQIGYGIVI